MNTRRSLASRYLRDVIGKQCLWPMRRPFDTCLRIRGIRRRYSYLTIRSLSSFRHPIAVLTDKPYIVGPAAYLKDMDDYGRLTFRYEHVRFIRRPPSDLDRMTLIEDGTDRRLPALPWKRVIRLDDDISQAPPSDQPWMRIPFPMHPLTYASGQADRAGILRDRPRSIRLFFAGNADRQVYASGSSMRAIGTRFGMMNRVEIMDAVAGLSLDMVWRLKGPADLTALLADGSERCVLALSGECGVPHKDWLETLARCDVFLAPPGVYMPLCHNIVEAMSVGCIPLTNYADWLSPPLTDGVNCLRFRDRDDLLSRVHDVRSAGSETIARLRRGVIEYYDRHLAREPFLSRLRAQTAPRVRLFVVSGREDALERVHHGSVVLAGAGS